MHMHICAIYHHRRIIFLKKSKNKNIRYYVIINVNDGKNVFSLHYCKSSIVLDSAILLNNICTIINSITLLLYVAVVVYTET